MKKITVLFIVIVALLVAAFYALVSYTRNEKLGSTQTITAADFKEASFRISGQPIALKNGISADGSVHYFGNELRADVDGDGAEDTVFLVTQNPGGSGTFFFVVAALKRVAGYIGSDATLIGDRIAPQTTEKGPGRSIVVNYADRKPNEPMATKPSVGKSLRLLLDPKTLQFGELVQNFEGESR